MSKNADPRTQPAAGKGGPDPNELENHGAFVAAAIETTADFWDAGRAVRSFLTMKEAEDSTDIGTEDDLDPYTLLQDSEPVKLPTP
ncbi:hypothetical protein [Amycolatopsis anabasis]|uniref:hypothetical protein n=1 Tax=Amycolatopsis anabasis TaxID=1840409 RepID=UPI00131D91FB|nr:hypothetical protein [Amycolatopsis anabasis]